MEVALALVGGQRRKDHRDGATAESRRLIDVGHGLEILNDAFQHHEAEFLVGVFTSLELEDEAHLVVAFEEGFRTAELDVVVVRAGADPELHLFHPRG